MTKKSKSYDSDQKQAFLERDEGNFMQRGAGYTDLEEVWATTSELETIYDQYAAKGYSLISKRRDSEAANGSYTLYQLTFGHLMDQ